MRKVAMSYKELSNLKHLKLDDSITHTESILSVLSTEDGEKLVKELAVCEGEGYDNKLYTIEQLEKLKHLLNIEEFVYPDGILIVDGHIEGFTFPLINGRNLSLVLSDKNITHEDKIKYLKQIGEVLEKTKKFRKKYKNESFYIGDLHEDNLLVEEKTESIKVVDLDSCKVTGNFSSPSKHLYANRNIRDDEYQYKYPFYNHLFETNENTDLLCYDTIILNYISKYNIGYLKVDDYYKYLDYLDSLGYPKPILDSFCKIYSNEDNDNVYELIDNLPDNFMASYNIFKARTRKKN